MHKRLATNLPMFYLGLVSDSAVGENVLRARTDTIAADVGLGKVKLPGAVQEEDEDANIVSAPPLPALEVLVYDQQEKIVKVPASVAKMWGLHANFGPRYASLMDEARTVGQGIRTFPIVRSGKPTVPFNSRTRVWLWNCPPDAPLLKDAARLRWPHPNHRAARYEAHHRRRVQ